MENRKYDAVIILGGGLTDDGGLPPWVQRRLDLALEYQGQTKLFITTSAGTTHKSPILNQEGFPLLESVAMANYLINQGLPVTQILTERWAYDTIGNAFFTRFIHTELTDLNNLLIITSDFHMPRSQAIFDWVFSLRPLTKQYQLFYQSASDAGLDPSIISVRVEKEKQGLTKLIETISKIKTVSQLHDWFFWEHSAYSLTKKDEPKLDPSVLRSY